MADRMKEVIQIVIEALGEAKAASLVTTLREIGNAGTLADDQLSGLVEGVQALSRQASESRGLQALVQQYRELAASQAGLAEEADRSGLRLRLATQQEAASAEALRIKSAALDAARAAQTAYAAQSERTAEGQRAVRDAVRAATAEQKAAQNEWRAANAQLSTATKQYERAAEAQEKTQREAAELARSIKAAGLSTDDLASAQAELASRAERAEREIEGLTQSTRDAADAAAQLAASKLAEEQEAIAVAARRAAEAEEELARASAEVARAQADAAARASRRADTEAAFLAEIRRSVAQQQAATRATDNLQRAREILERRSRSAGAAEQQYTRALGASASKIAAIGAAALGINSTVGLARSGLEQLLETAGKFQQLDVQLDSVFGERSAEAMTAIQRFAQETPYQLQQVSDAFVKLRAFGLDPLDGTFEAVADQAAKLGGTSESLTGIVLALGQAWAKQKLQGEEILQLVERGVPVWDLLQRATGKNVQELQKLSEAGKLGRVEIKALISEIGASSEGASAALANTLPGQINRLKGQWSEFLNLIANSGLLEHLQRQLAAVSEEVRRMADSGELEEWARTAADAIVDAAEAIRDVTVFLVEHREAILALAAAYATLKAGALLGGFVRMLGGLAGALQGSGAAAVTARTALSAIVSPIGLVATAATLAGAQLFNLAEAFGELRDAQELQREKEAELSAQNREFAERARALQDEYRAFAEVAIKTTAELGKESEESLGAYIARLQGSIEYTRGLGLEAIATRDKIGALAARGRVQDLEIALAAAKAQLQAVGEVARAVADRVGEIGGRAANTFDEIVTSGKSARDAVSKLFDGIDLTRVDGLKDAADILFAVGTRGKEAAAAIRGELRAEILKLSDEDFARFRSSAASAFASAKFGAEDLKRAVAGITLERLGIDIEEITTGFSAAGRVAIDAFSAAREEVEALGLTAEQRAQAIGLAFDAAFGQAKTAKDMEALRSSLQEAFASGEVSVAEYGKRIDEVNAKIVGLGRPGSGVGDAGKRVFEEAAAAAEQAAAQTEAIGDAGASAGQEVTHAFASVANAYAAWIGNFQQQSEAASQKFQQLADDLFRFGSTGNTLIDADSTRISRMGWALNEAARLVTEGIEMQRSAAEATAQAYADLSDSAVAAMIRTRGGVDAAASSLEYTAQLAREGKSEFDLLGAADLSGLAQAADAAAARVRQIGQEALSARDQLEGLGRSLQDQIDQLRGNNEAIERRRYEQQLEDLRALAEESGNLNSAEYNEAVRRAKELHDLKMRQLRDQREQQRRNDADSSTSQQSSRPRDEARPTSPGGSLGGGGQPLVITLPSGAPVNLVASDRAAADRLIEYLRQAAAASGRGGSLL